MGQEFGDLAPGRRGRFLVGRFRWGGRNLGGLPRKLRQPLRDPRPAGVEQIHDLVVLEGPSLFTQSQVDVGGEVVGGDVVREREEHPLDHLARILKARLGRVKLGEEDSRLPLAGMVAQSLLAKGHGLIEAAELLVFAGQFMKPAGFGIPREFLFQLGHRRGHQKSPIVNMNGSVTDLPKPSRFRWTLNTTCAFTLALSEVPRNPSALACRYASLTISTG